MQTIFKLKQQKVIRVWHAREHNNRKFNWENISKNKYGNTKREKHKTALSTGSGEKDGPLKCGERYTNTYSNTDGERGRKSSKLANKLTC